MREYFSYFCDPISKATLLNIVGRSQSAYSMDFFWTSEARGLFTAWSNVTMSDLPFAEVDLLFSQRDAALTIMCNRVLFHIYFNLEDLRGGEAVSSDLEQQFLQLKDSLYEEPESFSEWMVEPCAEHILKLVPLKQTPEPFTVAEYFNAPTFVFNLKNIESRLKAISQPDHRSITNTLVRKIPKTDALIASALQQDISSVADSSLEIYRKPDASEYEHNEYPRIVRIRGSESLAFLKLPQMNRASGESWMYYSD